MASQRTQAGNRQIESAAHHVEKYFAAGQTPDALWPDDKGADRQKVLDMAFNCSWRWNRAHHGGLRRSRLGPAKLRASGRHRWPEG